LKVGAPVRRESGAPILCAGNFLGRAPSFLGSKNTISRFGEHFHDGHYSFVSFLFAVLLLTVPPCPAIRKNGGTSPRAMESAPLHAFIIFGVTAELCVTVNCI